MSRNKDFKTTPAEEVFFVHTKEGWLIYSKKHSGCVFSVNNTWTDVSEKMKYFDLLHVAISLSRRRGFKFEIPDYSYEIINDEMHLFANGTEIGHVKDIKSEKQANDKMKELFHIHPSKMEML